MVKKEMAPLNAISSGQVKREPVFTTRDWLILQELLDVFELFADATEELSRISLSMILELSKILRIV